MGLRRSPVPIRLLHIYSGFSSKVYILRIMSTGKKLPKRAMAIVNKAPKTVDWWSRSLSGHVVRLKRSSK